MDEVKTLTESLNSLLGLVAIGGATFAANWTRKVVGTWLGYLKAKMDRWEAKNPEADVDQKITTAVAILRASWELKYGSPANIPDAKRDSLLNSAVNLVIAAVPEASMKRALVIAKILEVANAKPAPR